MASATKKLLIIGINSFTGKYLASYLTKAGYQISPASYEYYDITNKQQLATILSKAQPDYIIHLAAISFVGHKKATDFYKVNTIGTINILETLIKLNITPQKIILASSATVYGSQQAAILDESHCPQPINNYGASKYAMETLAQNFFSQLPIIIARPFNYTGIGQADNFLIPKIVKHYQQKQLAIELGNLNVIREFNDIELVCNSYQRLLASPHHSTTLNICSGRGVLLLDVIKMMDELAGYKIVVNVNPAYVRKNELKTLIGNPQKLINIIGELTQKPFIQTLSSMLLATAKT